MMKTISAIPVAVGFSFCVLLSAPDQGHSGEQVQQRSRKDTLTLGIGVPNSTMQKRLVQPLPRFHPGKDTAGFQFIPVYPNPSPVTVEKDAPLSPSLKMPEIIKKVEPVYPDSAKRAGLEGTVAVQIWVDEHGKARRVDILKSDADIFNRPAIDAARQFVFRPERTIGSLRYEFHFRLHENE